MFKVLKKVNSLILHYQHFLFKGITFIIALFGVNLLITFFLKIIEVTGFNFNINFQFVFYFLIALILFFLWIFICLKWPLTAILLFLFYSMLYQFLLKNWILGLWPTCLKEFFYLTFLFVIFISYALKKYDKKIILHFQDKLLIIFVLFATFYLFLGNKPLLAKIIEFRFISWYLLFVVMIQFTNISVVDFTKKTSIFLAVFSASIIILYLLNYSDKINIISLISCSWGGETFSILPGYGLLAGTVFVPLVYMVVFWNYKRIDYYVILSVLMSGLILSRARGWWVSFFITLIVLLFSANINIKKNSLVVISITLFLLLLKLPFGLFRFFVQGMQILFTTKQIFSAWGRNSRIVIYKDSIFNNPMGYGWGNVASKNAGQFGVYNPAFDIFYLQIVYAVGFIGCAIFVWWLFSEWLFLYQRRLQFRDMGLDKEWVLAVILLSCVIVLSFFRGVFFNLYFVLPMCGLLGLLRKSYYQEKF